MPVLARRTWAQMLTEAVLRTGNLDASGWEDRVKHALASAYATLCTQYHHAELDKIDTSVVCSTSTNEITLPADLFILVGIRLKAVGGASILGPVVIEDYRLVADGYSATAGRPGKGGRFGNKFYFDKKPDQAYPLEIFYYRRGTAPDFGTPTLPELDADVDEHILHAAARSIFPAIARPDLGEVQRQLLVEWMQQQVRSATAEGGLGNLPERERTATVYGGAQA